MRRLPTVLAAAILVAVASANALAAERFTDPAGDVDGGPAPDITAVTVAHEPGGSVTFSVEFAQEPPLSWSDVDGYTDMLMVLLSTGDAPATIEDAEYVIGVHAVTIDRGEFRSLRQGSGAAPRATVDVTVNGRTVSLGVPLSAIGSPAVLQFWVGVGREAAQGHAGGGSDSFPASGMQRYALDTAPWSPVGAIAVSLAAVGLLVVLVLRPGRRRPDPSRPGPPTMVAPNAGAPGNRP